MPTNRVPVKSTNIKSIGHDPVTNRLEVEFKNGAVYSYDNIGSKDYNDLVSAESVGSYFAQRFRSRQFTQLRVKGETSDGKEG